MFLHRYLTTMRSTYVFMVSCGLVMGAVFPFYSAIFFGRGAFSLLYVLGCLTAGFLVGSGCYVIIRQVLKLYVRKQFSGLSTLLQGEDTYIGNADDLSSLMASYDTVMTRVFAMVRNASDILSGMLPMFRRFDESSRRMIHGNEQQAVKGEESQRAMGEVNDFFNKLLKEISETSARANERASISTEMSATTDTIAGNIREYSQSVIDTSASMAEMSMSIRATADNIKALAESSEQTFHTIDRINSATGDVRDIAQSMAESADKVLVQAQEGMGAMATTLAAMRDIHESSNESIGAVRRLSSHTSRVGDLIDIINDVVNRTKLLSLNASIIAAQAGEQGKSFSVVADEVQALAHRTSASTLEIEELVKNILHETQSVEKAATLGQEKTTEGLEISGRTDQALRRIAESAVDTSQLAQKIASVTVEQAAGSTTITGEVSKNLDRVKLVNRAIGEQERGIEHIASSLESMRSVSQHLTASTEEQAKGNKLYLKSILEDNEQVKELRIISIQQKAMGDAVLLYLQESGSLIEVNVDESRRVLADIDTLQNIAEQLRRELAPFMVRPKEN
jgi:methyl-accepting chemotaxis protein